jgi:malonyl-CoA/methylmalonyl-CoA synthetase
VGWAATLLGIWRAGGIAVPLAVSHPPAELAYVLDDTGAALAVAAGEPAERLAPLCRERDVPLVRWEDLALAAREPSAGAPAPEAAPAKAEASPSARELAAGESRGSGDRAALILYTSGTTSRPKGVVWTHRGLAAQIGTLVEAWGWGPADRALHVLPLHHVHGIVNVLLCALWAGAACEMLPRFTAEAVWRRLASGEVTVFMAVPTIYARLLAAWEAAPAATRRRWSEGARRLRLMVSGSAALPVQTLERWREATGHTLLERYGMTEIGMALSNPLAGERVPGAVGRPLPGVEVRLVDEAGRAVAEGEPGQLLVRGPGLFREYWRRPEETAEALRDGWFQTGDVAVVEAGVYRILGRQSQDIIKTGGYKISALEIETVLRDHPAIADCAVVGLPDPEWGERVAAAVVLAPGAAALDLESLRTWARERLAPYKLPALLEVVADLPRNAMGKVVKPELVHRFPGSRA